MFYRHYKGNIYVSIKEGKNKETGKDMIIYHELFYEEGTEPQVWIQDKDRFEGTVEVEGNVTHRFTPINVDDVIAEGKSRGFIDESSEESSCEDCSSGSCKSCSCSD